MKIAKVEHLHTDAGQRNFDFFKLTASWAASQRPPTVSHLWAARGSPLWDVAALPPCCEAGSAPGRRHRSAPPNAENARRSETGEPGVR